MKKVSKHFIQLHPQRILGMFIYENTKDLDLIAMASDDEGEGFPDFNKTAKEIIDGLDDWWCVSLLEALHEEIEKTVVRHWNEYEESKSRLKEEPYKSWYKKHKKEIDAE
jgi:hypothetical protein